MKKIIITVILLINFSVIGFAENFNLYSNLDDSNQYCNLLVDYYYNLDDFEPFNEYVCIRDGQYQYTLIYGKSLSGNNLKYIRYIPSYMNNPSSISTGNLDSFNLSSSNFTYVGNVKGSLSSQQFQDYKFKFLAVISGFVFLLVFLFKVFKPKFNLRSNNRGYDL